MNAPPMLPEGVTADGHIVLTQRSIVPDPPMPGHEGHALNLVADLGDGQWRAACDCGDLRMVGVVEVAP